MNISAGLIFQIVLDAGIALHGHGDKRTLRCPFHQDRNASAFVSIDNVFFCSVCTPEKGWTAKQLSSAIGQPWITAKYTAAPPVVHFRPPLRAEDEFTPLDAAATWTASFARARDDGMVVDDRQVHDYVAERGLGEALELGAYGVLPTMGLHPRLARWLRSGHRVVAPLFTLEGDIASIQARSIVPDGLKTVNPKGSRVAGTVFADPYGRAVLAGSPAPRIVFGEGLTDMLALAITSPWPVLTAPGTSNAVRAVGSWAKGKDVLLALDADAAGDAAADLVILELRRHGARDVRRVRWPGGAKDACDVVATRGISGLHDVLQSPTRSEAA